MALEFVKITGKCPIDKNEKKEYNIDNSGKADADMKNCSCTSAYATPCKAAFSARNFRNHATNLQDTAVAVSVFVLLCLCVAADLIAAVSVGILVLVVVGIMIVRISKGRNRSTERKNSCIIP